MDDNQTPIRRVRVATGESAQPAASSDAARRRRVTTDKLEAVSGAVPDAVTPDASASLLEAGSAAPPAVPAAGDGAIPRRRQKSSGSTTPAIITAPDLIIAAAPAIIRASAGVELGARSPGSMTPDQMRAKCLDFETEYNKWVLGYRHIGRMLLMCLLMPGRVRHIYAEGMPGLAKSHMMETTARIVPGLKFKRIQCHSEVTPTQITGGREFDQASRTVKVVYGEIVGNHLVLADELPRATPNAQGGFLQAMAEGKVSLPGVPKPVNMEDPFTLLATANPAEQKGVYPLPEAQWDRFLFKIMIPYVEEMYAKAMLLRPELTDGSCYEMMQGQLTLAELLEIRNYIRDHVHVSAAFVDYLYEVVDCTRPGQKYFEKLIREHPETAAVMGMIKRGAEWGGGAGPRAEQCLLMASKINAFLYGVDQHNRPRQDINVHVASSDLKPLVNAALRARIILAPEAKYPVFQENAVTTDQIINLIMANVKPLADPNAYKRR